jgi:hypothetical protein
VNKQELTALYEGAASVSDLARNLDRSFYAVYYLLKKYDIPVRRKGFRSPKTVRHYAEKHCNWRGGTYITGGYVYEYAPNHPDAYRRKGYVAQHRLVMERNIGRPLASDELVHHINGNRADNRIENLEIKCRSSHISLHKENAPRDNRGRFTT